MLLSFLLTAPAFILAYINQAAATVRGRRGGWAFVYTFLLWTLSYIAGMLALIPIADSMGNNIDTESLKFALLVVAMALPGGFAAWLIAHRGPQLHTPGHPKFLPDELAFMEKAVPLEAEAELLVNVKIPFLRNSKPLHLFLNGQNVGLLNAGFRTNTHLHLTLTQSHNLLAAVDPNGIRTPTALALHIPPAGGAEVYFENGDFIPAKTIIFPPNAASSLRPGG